MKPGKNKWVLAIPFVIFSAIGLLFFSGIDLQNRFATFQKNHRASETEDEEVSEGKIPLKDRMDLAILQEIEFTKDLSTNTVPRERLVAAYNYAESLRQLAAGSRVAGAIPGITWQERGPRNVGGRTRTILVDPNDPTKKTVWAAGVGGGLWKTTDITQPSPVWTSINDLFNNIAITSIAYNSANTQEMYFGTGEGFYNADAIRGDGIWKTINGGTTWTQLAATAGSANFRYIQKVVVHPTGVYAATLNGLFRSTNGGTTWTKVLGTGTGAISDRISDIEISADNTLYVGVGVFTTDGVYKSTTGAAGAWSMLNVGGSGFATTGFNRIELACAPSNANTLYAVTQSSTTNGVYKIYQSTDGGVNWATKTNPTDADPGIGTDFTRTQAWYDLIAAVDPNNANTLYVGGVDLFKSTNGGTAWQQISHWYGGFSFQEVHADQHAIVFEPGNSNVLYFGNDGGVWRSSNATATIPTIEAKSDNYNVTQFYACAMNPAAYSSQFLAGAQDNGSQQFSGLGINATVEVTGGDGCFTHIDQNQPQYQFTSYVYNNYYRSVNTGATFAGITSNSTSGYFVNPTDYDDVGNNLYASKSAGDYYVIVNAPASGTLTPVTVAAFNSGRATAITVSPNTANRVFFGLNNGRVVKVDNAHTGSPTATNITGASMPAGTVSCIAVETGNDNHLLVTYSNYGLTSIWETTNGGTSWTSVEGNMPDMPVRWALFHPTIPSQAMVATELGVWSTDLLNGAATVWGPSVNGLANVRTDMLQIRSSDKLVIAATHGRGLYSTDAFADPYPDFIVDKKLTYTGKPLTFTDGSYKATSWLWNFGDATTAAVKNPVKSYTTPGLYTVTLQINGSAALQRVKTSYILVLPNKGIPYNPAAGGSFDVNPLNFGAETISGTPFEKGNSAIGGKNGTFSGSNAWVTGLSAANYLENTDTRLWTPNYNFSAPGIYTLKFYRKNNVEIGWDGFRIEYSLNKGDTWTALGTVVANWYDYANTANATSFPLNQPYFNGTKASFTLCQYDVSSLAGNANVAFRFRFKSDESVNAIGVAIDEFEITGPVNSPLPVELVSFTGHPFEKYNEIKWITVSELNNDHYELERSVNGIDFETIATIKGNGTTSKQNEYSYRDSEIENRNYYYRLMQVDFDGGSKYIGMILVKRAESNSGLISSVFPNPFSDKLNVIFSGKVQDEIRVSLYNVSGKEIFNKVMSSSGVYCTVDLNDSKLAAGTYLLKVMSGDETRIFKVFKE